METKRPIVLFGNDILVEISRHKSVGFFYSIKTNKSFFMKDLLYNNKE